MSMNLRTWVVAAASTATIGLLALGLAIGAPAARASAPGLAARAQAGFNARDVFLDKCATCHARDGSGHTIKGHKDGVKPVAETVKKYSEAQMIQIVTKGKGAYMNGFSDQFSPAQIKALVEYYRSLATQH
jgi:mono/diheme cytochrome c family protein